MPMAGMIATVWRRAISDFPENGSATKRLPTPAHRPAGAAEIAAVLADDGMVAAFRAALAGADVDDAGGAGPQRQHVLGIVGDDAHILHDDAVLVENSEQGEAVDDQLRSNSVLAYSAIPG